MPHLGLTTRDHECDFYPSTIITDRISKDVRNYVFTGVCLVCLLRPPPSWTGYAAGGMPLAVTQEDILFSLVK